MGVEPIRPLGQGILSPQRLPFRHSAVGFNFKLKILSAKPKRKAFSFGFEFYASNGTLHFNFSVNLRNFAPFCNGLSHPLRESFILRL
jgi:hypothetical protein